MKKALTFICILFFTATVFSQTQHRDISVYFDTAVYKLNGKERGRVDQFIKNLGKEQIKEIILYGFTDDRGSDDYNLRLSKKRALNVKQHLIGLGIDESLFKIVRGKGEVLIKKFTEVETDVVRGLNRKVTIDINTFIPKPSIDETDIGHKFEDVKIGDKLILENIHFQEGYAWVTKESFPHLKKLVSILKERDDIYIEIHGHVCCTRFGRDAIDRKTKKQNLSTARAKAIYNYLAKKGINKRRMRYKGMRRKFPLGKGSEYDRRVEIVIKNIIKDADRRKFKANY